MGSPLPPPQLSPDLQAQVNAEKIRLAEFLATGPLYTLHVLPELAGFDILLGTIELLCVQCRKPQTFERMTSYRQSDRGWGLDISYRCRNCQKQRQAYWYVWQKGTFWKVGQLPELYVEINRQLDKALGDSKALYKKAVRSRSFGFGIGALSYLRRIIEDTTDSLMALLREDKWDTWSSSERQQFEAAQATNQYSRKMSYAASAILPAGLFAGGSDSFSALHDVTSAGLHGKTEEECIELFDRCNLIFTQSFKILFQHRKEREEFAEELSKLRR